MSLITVTEILLNFLVQNQRIRQLQGQVYSHMGPSSVMRSNAHDAVVPSVAQNCREEILEITKNDWFMWKPIRWRNFILLYKLN